MIIKDRTCKIIEILITSLTLVFLRSFQCKTITPNITGATVWAFYCSFPSHLLEIVKTILMSWEKYILNKFMVHHFPSQSSRMWPLIYYFSDNSKVRATNFINLKEINTFVSFIIIKLKIIILIKIFT